MLTTRTFEIISGSLEGTVAAGEDSLTPQTYDWSYRKVKDKSFELSNHLGNVLTVITDRKIELGTTDTYAADVVSYADYSPYGMLLQHRHGQETNAGYRFGFQGQEMDDEIKGEGNSINYEYRMHDPRIGRFFAIDPLAAKYPWYTPYQFSGNKLIAFVELEGLEEIEFQKKDKKTGEYYGNTNRKKATQDQIHALKGQFGIEGDNYSSNEFWRITTIYEDGKVIGTGYERYIPDEKTGKMTPLNKHVQPGEPHMAKLYQDENNALNNALSISRGDGDYDPLVGYHDGATNSQLDAKDIKVGTKMIIGILTLGYAGPALLGEMALVEAGTVSTTEITLTTIETAYAADDLIGTTIGAAKDDVENDHKPLKGIITHYTGPIGGLIYDAGNIGSGIYGGTRNMRGIAGEDASKSLPLFLDGYGLTDGIFETQEDLK